MKRSLAALLAVSLVACGGETATEPPPPPPAGPLSFGIVSGQNQTVHAGHDSLTQPVVVALMRAPSGRLTMRIVGTGVNAQTIVNGSPVHGAVICAHPDSLHPLVPWVQCTNTDSTGHAPMWFNPGTRAGHPSAEIRGTLNGEPAVFDTATATVLPGPAATLTLSAQAVTLFTGQSYDWHSLISSAADQYGNTTGTDSTAIAGDTLLASEGTGRVTYVLDSARSAVAVTVLDDLSRTQWATHYRCGPSGSTDSSDVEGSAQTITYRGSPTTGYTLALSRGVIRQTFWFPGDSVATYAASAPDTTTWLVLRQSPVDSVALALVNGVGTFRQTADAPRSFETAATPCGVTLQPLTLTAAP